MNASSAMQALIAAYGGSISWERFMEFALHDPQHGYYARRIAAVGTKGDFTTTAEISPALAKAIAATVSVAMKKNNIRHLIEIGPGNGTLAATVWKNLPTITRWRTKLHLVDTSSPLREAQQRNPQLKTACYHADLPAALAATQGQAVIYTNELLDAFPVRVMRHSCHAWQELFLRCDDGIIAEQWQDSPSFIWPSTSPLPRENQRIEVPAAAARWLQGWLPQWKKGSMLHIDYGYYAPDYSRLPRHGSLRGYLLHQRRTGAELYQNIGRTDITADVDFTMLKAAIASHTSDHSIMTQGEFLAPYADPQHPGDQQAIDPAGAGTAFLVWSSALAEKHQ